MLSTTHTKLTAQVNVVRVEEQLNTHQLNYHNTNTCSSLKYLRERKTHGISMHLELYTLSGLSNSKSTAFATELLELLGIRAKNSTTT